MLPVFAATKARKRLIVIPAHTEDLVEPYRFESTLNWSAKKYNLVSLPWVTFSFVWFYLLSLFFFSIIFFSDILRILGDFMLRISSANSSDIIGRQYLFFVAYPYFFPWRVQIAFIFGLILWLLAAYRLCCTLACYTELATGYEIALLATE